VIRTWTWANPTTTIESETLYEQATFEFDRITYGSGENDYIDLSGKVENYTTDFSIYLSEAESVTASLKHFDNQQQQDILDTTITREGDTFTYELTACDSGSVTITLSGVTYDPSVNYDSNYINFDTQYDSEADTLKLTCNYNQVFKENLLITVYIPGGVNKTLNINLVINNPYVTFKVNGSEWDGVTPLKQGDVITYTVLNPAAQSIQFNYEECETYTITYATGESLDFCVYDGNRHYITGKYFIISDFKLPYEKIKIGSTEHEIDSLNDEFTYRLSEGQTTLDIEMLTAKYQGCTVVYSIGGQYIPVNGNKISLDVTNLDEIDLVVLYNEEMVYNAEIEILEYSLIEGITIRYLYNNENETIEKTYLNYDETISIFGIIEKINVKVKEGYSYTCDFDNTNQTMNQIVTIRVFAPNSSEPVLVQELELEMIFNLWGEYDEGYTTTINDITALTVGKVYELYTGFESPVVLTIKQGNNVVADNTITVAAGNKEYTAVLTYGDVVVEKAFTIVGVDASISLSNYINTTTPMKIQYLKGETGEKNPYTLWLSDSVVASINSLPAGFDREIFIDSLESQFTNALLDNTNKVSATIEGQMVYVTISDASDNELIKVYLQLYLYGQINNDNGYSLYKGFTFDESDYTAVQETVQDGAITVNNLYMFDAVYVVANNEYARIELYAGDNYDQLVDCSFGNLSLMYTTNMSYKVVIYPTDGSTPNQLIINMNGIQETALSMTIGDDTYTANVSMYGSSAKLESDFFKTTLSKFDVVNGVIENRYIGHLGEEAIEENQETFVIDSITTMKNFGIYDATTRQKLPAENIELEILTDDNGYKYVTFLAGPTPEYAYEVCLYFSNDAYLNHLTFVVNGQTKKLAVAYLDIQTYQAETRGDFEYQLLAEDMPCLVTSIDYEGESLPATLDVTVTFDNNVFTSVMAQSGTANYDAANRTVTLEDVPVTNGYIMLYVNQMLPAIININLVQPSA